ncbi:hypothetical protein MMC22_005489 [Lobaria immixta]|nr:hypothetical protein [Lobaria immixta]
MPPTIIDLTEASSPAPAEPEIVPVEVLLKQAIDKAQPSRLRNTLVTICDGSPEAARIAGSLLLVPEKGVRYLSAEESSEEEEEDEDENEEDEKDEDKEDEQEEGNDKDISARSNGNDQSFSHDETEKGRKETSGSNHAMELAANDLKRMRTRYAMCENCAEEFDVADNLKGYCCWHDGELEPDYDGDFWADHDERCHGIIDTEDMRSVYPEGFIYSCCDGDGHSEGCKTGRHVEQDLISKRPRY